MEFYIRCIKTHQMSCSFFGSLWEQYGKWRQYSKCGAGQEGSWSQKETEEQPIYKYICTESRYFRFLWMPGTFQHDLASNSNSKGEEKGSSHNISRSCQYIWVSAPMTPMVCLQILLYPRQYHSPGQVLLPRPAILFYYHWVYHLLAMSERFHNGNGGHY